MTHCKNVKVFKVLSVILLVLSIIVSVTVIGPSIEEKYFPVITVELPIDIVYNSETNRIVYKRDFTKNRNCTIAYISAEIEETATERRKPVKYWIFNDPQNYSILQSGHYHGGAWTFSVPFTNPKNLKGRLLVRSEHVCHPLYNSPSAVLDVDLTRVPEGPNPWGRGED